ncbi:hypothetical protein GCM10009744_28070 [Kribbella alba]|uniref:Uncharacterized protein n=1 Tax=Kribbella alba TaxID=190197 RepID=A0ABP4R5G0_9ACTN
MQNGPCRDEVFPARAVFYLSTDRQKLIRCSVAKSVLVTPAGFSDCTLGSSGVARGQVVEPGRFGLPVRAKALHLAITSSANLVCAGSRGARISRWNR